MLSREADAVLARLEDAGHAAYAVGGCVRDLLRGAVPDVYKRQVVRVVIEHVRAVERPLVLKAAARAVERGETLLHGAAGDAQHIGSRGRGEGVEDIVPPGDVQLDVGIRLAADHDIKRGAAVVEGDIVGGAVGVRVGDAEGEHRV